MRSQSPPTCKKAVKRSRSPPTRVDGEQPEKRSCRNRYCNSLLQDSDLSRATTVLHKSDQDDTELPLDEVSSKLNNRGTRANGEMTKDVDSTSVPRGRSALKDNFKILKEEMEPIQVADILKQCGIINATLHDDIVDGLSRQQRVDILIKALDNLMKSGDAENEVNTFIQFLEALEASRQHILVKALQTKAEHHQASVSEIEIENKKLLRFYTRTKETLLKELEPLQIIDDIVMVHGLDFPEHDSVVKKTRREDRVDILFKKLEADDTCVWKILRPICKLYKNLYSDFEKSENMTATVTSDEERPKPSVRFQFTRSRTIIKQDTNEHTDTASQLKKMQRCIVANVNGDADTFHDLNSLITDDCAASLSRLTFSSIEIHLESTCKESLQRVKDCCTDGRAMAWLLSILNQEDRMKLKKMEATTIEVEVFYDYSCKKHKRQLFDEVVSGCLCTLNRDCLKRQLVSFTKNIAGLEEECIHSLLKSNTLTAEVAHALTEIKTSSSSDKALTKNLIEFMLHQDITQVSFCVIENEILKKERPEFVRHMREESKSASSSDSSDALKQKVHTISTADIQDNVALLEEELDANWFLVGLESSGSPDAGDMVDIIEKSVSRTERTKPFVKYLCDAETLDWFCDELQLRNRHLLDRLLLQKKADTTVPGITHALLGLYDMIVEELEPLQLELLLSSSCLHQLHFSDIALLESRQERASLFMEQLLKKDNEDRIREVIDVMKTVCSSVAHSIQDVLQKGSMCEHYICPRIQNMELKQHMPECVLATQFTLSDSEEKADLQLKSTRQHTNAGSTSRTFIIPNKETEITTSMISDKALLHNVSEMSSQELIQNKDLTPSQELIQNKDLTPNQELIQKKDLTPNHDLIQKKDLTPNHDLIQKKDLTPNQDLIQKKDSTPNQELIQNKDLTPNQDLIQKKDLTPNQDLIQKKDLTPNQELIQKKDLTPNQELIQKKDLKPSQELSKINKSIPKPWRQTGHISSGTRRTLISTRPTTIPYTQDVSDHRASWYDPIIPSPPVFYHSLTDTQYLPWHHRSHTYPPQSGYYNPNASSSGSPNIQGKQHYDHMGQAQHFAKCASQPINCSCGQQLGHKDWRRGYNAQTRGTPSQQRYADYHTRRQVPVNRHAAGFNNGVPGRWSDGLA